jgi:hypothetical protein
VTQLSWRFSASPLRYQGREPYFNAGRASKVPSIPLGLLTKNMDFDPD